MTVTKPHLWSLERPQPLHAGDGGARRAAMWWIANENAFRHSLHQVRCPERALPQRQPLKVKGTCNHQDHAGLGAALPDAVQYYRVRKLKEMGSML